MARQAQRLNPFRVLTHPDVVLAAVESSEHLSRLNRHLCRPLDRPAPDAQDQADEPGQASGPQPETRQG